MKRLLTISAALAVAGGTLALLPATRAQNNLSAAKRQAQTQAQTQAKPQPAGQATDESQNQPRAQANAQRQGQSQGQNQRQGRNPAQGRPGAAGQPRMQLGSGRAINPDDLSYALGYAAGRRYAQSGAKVNLQADKFAAGMKVALSDKKPKMSVDKIRETLMTFDRQMKMKQMRRYQTLAKKGESYLKNNKKKKGVHVTDDGLQYQIMKKGRGESPTGDDTVKVNYRGKLVDGSVFDSSYKRNHPAEFQVNQVIPGWTEALKLMKPGAKWRLVIPPKLAYGKAGRPPVIPPNSVLIFDVELLSARKSAPGRTAGPSPNQENPGGDQGANQNQP